MTTAPRHLIGPRRLEAHPPGHPCAGLIVESLDSCGPGDPGYLYRISGYDPRGNATGPLCDPPTLDRLQLLFQRDDPAAVGLNGVTVEALLAIVEHRLRGWSGGLYPSEETTHALVKIQEAQLWLAARTRRLAAGR